MEAYDLTFAGFNGDKIKGWYLLPKFVKKEKLPVVVIYHGYSGGRGQIADYSQWILLGCAVAVMDTRGQGGATGNMFGYSNPSVGGWMTKGILDKNEYYYRAVYRFLREVYPEDLRAKAEDSRLSHKPASVLARFGPLPQAQTAKTATGHGLSSTRPVAYFCAEFGVHESPQTYAGGTPVSWPATTLNPRAISRCHSSASGSSIASGLFESAARPEL